MKIIPNIEFAPGLAGDLFLPDGQTPDSGFPAALLIHGGGWSGMDRHSVGGIADFLSENGFAVFNIDYRLTPQHHWPAGLDDCKAGAQRGGKMIIYGIVAMILVGVSWTAYGYVMGKAPRQKIKIPYLMIISALFTFAISGCIGLCQGFPRLSAFGYFITFGILIIYGITNYFQLDLMSRAMQRGPNGIIWSIIQSAFVFPFFMGVIFFGVELNLLRMIGLISLLLSLVFFGTGQNKSAAGSWKLLTFNAFLITGITQMLSNLPSYYPEAEAVNSIWRTAAFSAGIGIGAISVELAGKKPVLRELSDHFRRIAVWKTVLLLELPEMISSWILLFPGMDILSKAGIGSIAYPIMIASCIIVFELFAIVILKEKRTMLQRIALLLCLLGVIGICM